MGFASATSIAVDMINSIEEYVDDPNVRYRLYVDLIETLTDSDWDTLDEAEGISDEFDRAVEDYYRRL